MFRYLKIAAALVLSLLLASPAWSSASKEITYLSKDDFLQQAFGEQSTQAKAVWVKGKLKDDVNRALGHDYPALRVRYWINKTRTAWILDEIGKEKPITAGFVIQDGIMVNASVLVFRESRGDEVHYPSFTKQFEGAQLTKKLQLDRHIDGISGATLSVNAMRKLAAVALLLSNHVTNKLD